MYKVDVYLRVRRAVMVDGMSIREASRVFGLHRETVRKMTAYSVPPGYRRQNPPKRPKPGALHRRHRPDTGVGPERSQEAAHTAKRVHHRQGLRKGAPPPDQGDVRAVVPLPGRAGERPPPCAAGPDAAGGPTASS